MHDKDKGIQVMPIRYRIRFNEDAEILKLSHVWHLEELVSNNSTWTFVRCGTARIDLEEWLLNEHQIKKQRVTTFYNENGEIEK